MIWDLLLSMVLLDAKEDWVKVLYHLILNRIYFSPKRCFTKSEKFYYRQIILHKGIKESLDEKKAKFGSQKQEILFSK